MAGSSAFSAFSSSSSPSSAGRKRTRNTRGRGGGRGTFRPNTPTTTVVGGLPHSSTPAEFHLDFADNEITSGFGFDLLCRMGYHPTNNTQQTQHGSPTPPQPSEKQCQENEMEGEKEEEEEEEEEESTTVRTNTSAPIPIVVRTTRAGLGLPVTQQHTRSLPPRSNRMKGAAPRSRDHEFQRALHLQTSQRTTDSFSPVGAIATPPHSSSRDSSSPSMLEHSFEGLSLDDDHVRDPLRPRCRFNPTHVVQDLKHKQKHERRCPDNPHRQPRNSPSPAQTLSFSPRPLLTDSIFPVSAYPALFGQDSAHHGGSSDSADHAEMLIGQEHAVDDDDDSILSNVSS